MRFMPSAPCRKLLTPEALLQRLAQRRNRSPRQTMVFTNGCFDILHVGHIRYLRQARKLGDCLIVGINSDQSVRRLKGAGRPVNPLADRAEILAALPFVTWLVEFDDVSVEPLVRCVRPDVLVKGGDYALRDIVGAAFVRSYGGKVVVLAHAPGRSTSHTIRRLNPPKPQSKPRRRQSRPTA